MGYPKTEDVPASAGQRVRDAIANTVMKRRSQTRETRPNELHAGTRVNVA